VFIFFVLILFFILQINKQKIGSFIVIFFFLWQFYTSPNRKLFQKNLRKILNFFSDSISDNINVVERLGDEIEKEEANKSYRNINNRIDEIKSMVKGQYNLATLITEGISFLLFKSKSIKYFFF
jgi:hypothetical protein